jgi:hypothetical protein
MIAWANRVLWLLVSSLADDPDVGVDDVVAPPVVLVRSSVVVPYEMCCRSRASVAEEPGFVVPNA